MDKFAVLKRIGSFEPRVAETFDDIDMAKLYLQAMRSKYDGWEYQLFVIANEHGPND